MRQPLFALAAAALLLQSSPAVFAAGESAGAPEIRPCADALAPGQDAETTPEDAIVRAWFELCLPDSAVAENGDADTWVPALLSRLRAGEAVDAAFTAPLEFLSSDAREGIEALGAVVSALSFEGTLDTAELVRRLVRRIESRLDESERAGSVHAFTEEERSEMRLRVHSVRVGGAIESPVLQLPDGTIVATSTVGDVVFTDRQGRIRARHELKRMLYGAPIRLGGGRILVLAALGRSVLFEADGSRVLDVDTPEVFAGVRPLLLQDGSLMILGRYGSVQVLSADGVASVETQVWEQYSTQPVRLSDGMVVFVSEAGELKFHSASGQFLKRASIGARVVHDVAQLADGTLVVAEEFSRVHFLNADGTPKKSWLVLNSHVDLKKRIAFAPIPLPDGRVAVVTANGLVSVMTSAGKIDFQAWTSSTIGIPPLLLRDGSILLATGEAGMGTPETEFFRVTPQGESISVWLTGDVVTSAPILLPGGEVALGTMAGEWVVLDPLAPEGMREISRGRTAGALRMRSTPLSDGGIAIGGDSGHLLLFDAELAKEGFSF